MTEPSLVEQTITISHNIAITAGSALAFAGFMIGYAIDWRQRRSETVSDARDVYHFGGPLYLGQLPVVCETDEDRVRRYQQ
ncbi:hypothetical protein AB7M63_003631 [Bradyrhizobium japonicum]